MNKRLKIQGVLNENKRRRGDLAKDSTFSDMLTKQPDDVKLFFKYLICRMLKILSTTVFSERVFDVNVDIVDYHNRYVMVIGFSFCPYVGDDVSGISSTVSKEIVEIAKMTGFFDLIGAIAVNGVVEFVRS